MSGLNFDVHVDVNKLLDQIGITQPKEKSIAISESDVGEGRFISVMGDGKVAAFYYHEKRHGCTAIGEKKAHSVVDGGRWAYAVVSQAERGNRTYWDNEPDKTEAERKDCLIE